MNCLFCKIVDGQIPSQKVFESETVLAFRDVSPQAPTHVLVIPKKHISSLATLAAEELVLVPQLFEAIQTIAKSEGISESGFRVVANTGSDGGQTVFHLHFHVLGGRSFHWPPG